MSHPRNALVLLLVSLCTTSCSLFGGSPRTFDYPVRRGDTLFSISQRYSVTLAELVDVNDLDDPNRLSVGQVLRVPSGGQGPAIVSTRPPTTKSDAGSAKQIRLSEARRYIGQMIWPAPKTRLVSKFGPRWNNFHEGLDLAGPVGTPIYAALDGVVVYSNNKIRGYGNIVVIRSPGLLHVYAHNDRNLVRVGQTVKRGARIAELGQTGHVTGPHLHFETRIKDRNGKNVAIDPLVFFR